MKEIRCECRRKTLLAMYGLNDKGERFIDVKVSKQRRVMAHVVTTSGNLKIWCRDCKRWYTINIPPLGEATLTPEVPSAIPQEPPTAAPLRPVDHPM